MSEDKVELGRRVVACKGWRWMPGMRWWTDDDDRGRLDDYQPEYMGRPTDALPDLTDAATVGCMLALVRQAWRCPTVYARESTTRRVSDGVIAWEVCNLYLDAEACRALGVSREGSVGSWGHGSEAEALVAALESAP